MNLVLTNVYLLTEEPYFSGETREKVVLSGQHRKKRNERLIRKYLNLTEVPVEPFQELPTMTAKL